MRRCDNFQDVSVDSPRGGVKDVGRVCQLMERCDAHGSSVQELGKV